MCRPQTLILSALLALLAALAGCNQAASGPANAQSSTVAISSTRLQAINLSADQNALPVGLSEQFQATGAYSDGTSVTLGAGLIWTSSDTTVLTVDSNGLATAVAVGSAKVTVQDPVSQAQGSLSVTVTAAVLESLSVSPASGSLPVGLGMQLTATGHFSDGTRPILTTGVTWQSATSASAAVDGNGLVTAVAVGGPVAITASFNGQSAAAQVTVSAAVLQAVTVNPPSATLAAGLTVQLAASASYSDGSSAVLTSGVMWSSSDPTVATVLDGQVTGVAAGAVTVTAAFAGLNGAAQLTVSPALLQAMTVNPSAATVAAGQTVQLAASGGYSDGSSADLSTGIAWTSSDNTVATVLGGQVTGIAPGTATVTAAFGGLTATASVTVTPATAGATSSGGTTATLLSIRISPANAVMTAGSALYLSAIANHSDGTTAILAFGLTWSSSNPAKAAVSQRGLVTAVQPGDVVITVSQPLTGLSASTSVKVRPNPEGQGQDGHGDGDGNGHD